VPDHRMATELMIRADRPIAAPSANLFTHLSPTRIEHLSPEIRSSCEVILDGGQCRIGIESTIVDMTSSVPRVLRHGKITPLQIQAVLGVPVEEVQPGSIRVAPGMYEKHYSPNTPVMLVPKLDARQSGLTFGATQNSSQIHMPKDPGEYAFELYAALFDLDQQGLGVICIEEPPRAPEWSAIWERLVKAKSSG
jgi:L-threonylcarbamoyladenylate synthase